MMMMMKYTIEVVGNHPDQNAEGYSERFVVWHSGKWASCADPLEYVIPPFKHQWITIKNHTLIAQDSKHALMQFFEYEYGPDNGITLEWGHPVSGQYIILGK